jgi:hypothetical protein
MTFDFYMSLTIDDEDVEVLVEYCATRCFDEIDLGILRVTLDGQEIVTLPEQDKAILEECLERVDDDLQADADAEGDYRYEMARDDY